MTTLEKIREEIEAVEPKSNVQYGMRWADSTLMIPFHKVMQIIDKYAEQEPTHRDCISRDYLLSLANKDGAYGYVSAHDIINAPTFNPQGPKTGVDE